MKDLMKAQMMGLAAALACGVGVCGENFLKNGDFEGASAKGWGNWCPHSKAKVVKAGAHGGAYCLEYEVDSDKGGFIVNFTPLPSNGTYTVSGWLKGDAGIVEVRLFYRTADGKYLGETPAFTASKLADWTHFAKAFLPPERCEAVQVGLHVARGRAWMDDVRVETGDRIGEAPNEIPNSAFAYILHENGMPELWNTGGGYSFYTFKPGVHEGEYYRMAPEEEPPVKGARVLFQRGIGFSTWKTGPLAGGTDYVLSIWAKSEAQDAWLELGFGGKSEKFALSNGWRRCVLKTHLKSSIANGYPRFTFFRNPVYLSAPMLHAGSEALPWKPSPLDANFADLKGGTQTATKTPGIITLCVPDTSEWQNAAKIVEFHPLAASDKAEKSKYRAFVRRQGERLFVAVESDSGRKPSVPAQEGKPLVLGNDAAELFVSSSESGAPYVQFMGGRNGACAATLGSQGEALRGGWRYTAAETEKGWRAEYELPLDLFRKPDGDCWRINVGVTDFGGAKPRYYSATTEGFHASRNFIRLTGLPRGGKAVSPRAAAEFDCCTRERSVRVAVEDAEGEAAASLYDARNRVVATAPVRNGQAEFAIADIAEGAYEIVVKAANGVAKTNFRKAPAAERFTRINRFKRQIEMDGKPFFPMVYSWIDRSGALPSAWQIKELKTRNFNTIMLMPELYSPHNRRMTPEFRVATVKAFADAGFKFIVWAGAGDFKTGGIPALVKARQGYIRELEAFKKDIVGWYYVDEIGPFWEKNFNVRPEDYPKGYRAMKDFDPGRLHFINWNWTGLSENMPWYGEQGATDLYSLDCYPYSNNLYGYGALSTFERGAKLLHGRVRERYLPGLMWLQTYNYHEGVREPMPVEYRNNVCIGLINRVSGFMSFIGCPENKDLWDEMGNSYALALKWLEMTARSGAEEMRRGKQGCISYALWKDGCGGYALVAANTLYAPQKAVVASGGRLNSNAVRLVGGEGTLVVGADGTLEVSLPVAGSAAWFIKPKQ